MPQQEAHIAGTGIAVPYAISTEQFFKVDRKARRAAGLRDKKIDLLHSLVEGTGVANRHYAHPYWTEGLTPRPTRPIGAAKEDIFTPNMYNPPYHERMKVYRETCVELGIKAARLAIEDWGGSQQEITHIFTTCTSGWNEPGLAVGVMQALDLPFDCAKAELNFNGCFCGATCLRLARDAIRAGSAKAVLVVAVEVASTHYDPLADDMSSLVAHSLFADGAAAVVLTAEGAWRYDMSGMAIIPESSDLLGLSPPLDKNHQSYRMHLDRKTGSALGQYFRTDKGGTLLHTLHSAEQGPFPELGIHPGGPNILDSVKEVFDERGWPDGAMQYSYETLKQYGNLGSAAMLFVLANCIQQTDKQSLITMAFGPGVTVEWAKLYKV